MTRLEGLEAKLEERRIARNAARDEQKAVDLEAKFALLDEFDTLATVEATGFKPGVSVLAFVRAPNAAEYKRYKDQLFRAADKKSAMASKDAGELMARACWVYPPVGEAQSAMLEAFAGLVSSISAAAIALAEGKVEEEKNG